MKPVLTAALVLLAGCTHLAVQDMDNGQHTLTATADSGGVSGSHEEAVEQANDYCGKNGQQAVIGSFYDRSAPGPKGEHASTIIFSCAAPRVLHF